MGLAVTGASATSTVPLLSSEGKNPFAGRWGAHQTPNRGSDHTLFSTTLPDCGTAVEVRRLAKTGIAVAAISGHGRAQTFEIHGDYVPRVSTGVAHLLEHVMAGTDLDGHTFCSLKDGSLLTRFGGCTEPDGILFACNGYEPKSMAAGQRFIVNAFFRPDICDTSLRRHLGEYRLVEGRLVATSRFLNEVLDRSGSATLVRDFALKNILAGTHDASGHPLAVLDVTSRDLQACHHSVTSRESVFVVMSGDAPLSAQFAIAHDLFDGVTVHEPGPSHRPLLRAHRMSRCVDLPVDDDRSTAYFAIPLDDLSPELRDRMAMLCSLLAFDEFRHSFGETFPANAPAPVSGRIGNRHFLLVRDDHYNGAQKWYLWAVKLLQQIEEGKAPWQLVASIVQEQAYIARMDKVDPAYRGGLGRKLVGAWRQGRSPDDALTPHIARFAAKPPDWCAYFREAVNATLKAAFSGEEVVLRANRRAARRQAAAIAHVAKVQHDQSDGASAAKSEGTQSASICSNVGDLQLDRGIVPDIEVIKTPGATVIRYDLPTAGMAKISLSYPLPQLDLPTLHLLSRWAERIHNGGFSRSQDAAVRTARGNRAGMFLSAGIVGVEGGEQSTFGSYFQVGAFIQPHVQRRALALLFGALEEAGVDDERFAQAVAAYTAQCTAAHTSSPHWLQHPLRLQLDSKEHRLGAFNQMHFGFPAVTLRRGLENWDSDTWQRERVQLAAVKDGMLEQGPQFIHVIADDRGWAPISDLVVRAATRVVPGKNLRQPSWTTAVPATHQAIIDSTTERAASVHRLFCDKGGLNHSAVAVAAAALSTHLMGAFDESGAGYSAGAVSTGRGRIDILTSGVSDALFVENLVRAAPDFIAGMTNANFNAARIALLRGVYGPVSPFELGDEAVKSELAGKNTFGASGEGILKLRVEDVRAIGNAFGSGEAQCSSVTYGPQRLATQFAIGAQKVYFTQANEVPAAAY